MPKRCYREGSSILPEPPSGSPRQLAGSCRAGTAQSSAGAAGRGCSCRSAGSLHPCPEAHELAAGGSKGARGYGDQRHVTGPLRGVKFPSWAVWFCLLSSPGAECPVYVFAACNNRCFVMSAWTDRAVSGFGPQNCAVERDTGACCCLLCF